MYRKPLLLALASFVLLAGCTASEVRQDYLPATFSPYIKQALELPPSGDNHMKVMEQAPNGNSFAAYLSRNYKSLMLFENDLMGDYVSADMYAQRALLSAKGNPPEPLPLDQFDLPADHLPALTESRAKLMELFGKGAREKFPAEAALAQSKFDCWVEQQEENHQPHHITQCRDDFIAALNDLSKKMTPPPPPPPAPKAMPAPMFKDSYIVYFDFDEVAIGDAGRATLAEVLKALQTQNAGASIIGYTDTAGPASYNQTLSEKRAKAVADVLLEAGIRPAVVTTTGRGENDLATATSDNVREAANRRAVINIR